MDGYDGHGSPAPHGGADWPDDPADQWILDPETGEYRMRLPGERPPAARSGDAGPPARRPVGAELELRSTRTDLEPVRPAVGPRSAARAADRGASRTSDRTASRTASRAADRRSRRGGGRRRGTSSSGGGLWLAGTLGLIGLLGCGTGGYLLVHHDATSRTAYCAAAPNASAPAAPSPHQTGPTLGPGPSATPIEVRVTIYDGSGHFGEAETVLSWMQNEQGYTRTSNGGPVKQRASTSLVYAPDHASQARTLAAAMHLPPSALHGTGKGSGYYDPMILTLGRDFRAPGVPLTTPSIPAPATSGTPADCAR